MAPPVLTGEQEPCPGHKAGLELPGAGRSPGADVGQIRFDIHLLQQGTLLHNCEAEASFVLVRQLIEDLDVGRLRPSAGPWISP